MTKIEVGMRVRCVDPHECEEWYSAGSEGVVKRIDQTGDIWVEFDVGVYMDDGGDRGTEWCGEASWFEVVTA